jgi:hypothetical protein
VAPHNTVWFSFLFLFFIFTPLLESIICTYH